MFEKFNQDIGVWNVSKVEDMYRIFLNCKSFNQDLSGWVLKSTNIKGMFIGCDNFDFERNWK